MFRPWPQDALQNLLICFNANNPFVWSVILPKQFVQWMEMMGVFLSRWEQFLLEIQSLCPVQQTQELTAKSAVDMSYSAKVNKQIAIWLFVYCHKMWFSLKMFCHAFCYRVFEYVIWDGKKLKGVIIVVLTCERWHFYHWAEKWPSCEKPAIYSENHLW